MSIKAWLMPAISQRLLSRERLLARRAKAERLRLALGGRHQLHYFHQVDDPYSALVAACLPQLLARYDIELLPHLVGPPPPGAAPERDMLLAYSRQDAQRLARHWCAQGLDFHDPGCQPSAQATSRAAGLLLAALAAGRFAELAGPVCAVLWRGQASETAWPGAALVPADPADVAIHQAAADALRQRLGHYLGATFFYAGEWFWGLDRLHHLERRLQDLGAQRPGVHGLMFAPEPDLQQPVDQADPAPIEFFFSLRSPYSAIVAPRVLALGRFTGAQVRLRYLLPMVMRGLPVPPAKRRYISLDAAREAFERGIPFGRVNDPLGRPTERGLALMALADRVGLGPAYLLSFMQGVWAEGLDAGSDRGLRRMAERAGLRWDECRFALRDPGWRETAENNRREMFALGLWGVPSFRVGDTVVWGQDRLWAIEQALLNPTASLDRNTP